MQPKKPTRSHRWSDLSVAAKGMVVLFFVTIGLVTLELSARAFWWIERGIPPFQTQNLELAFYPELAPYQNAEPVTNDLTFDVLILGASTVKDDFGTIGPRLAHQLGERLYRPIRIHNLARSAHTSRDSHWKYQRLAKEHFDLVVVYDGFNETRMNNAPRSIFKPDYSHCSWYRQIQLLGEHPEMGYLAFPYTLQYLAIQAADDWQVGPFITRHEPRPEWLAEGSDVKTPASFEEEMTSIVDIAKSRDEPLVLMTFAHHLAEGYNLEAFRDKKLDYAGHRLPVEIWGTPDHVVKAVQRHNQVVAKIADTHPEVLFVDQAKLIKPEKTNFDDICHLTDKGCEAFVHNVMVELDPPASLGRRSHLERR